MPGEIWSGLGRGIQDFGSLLAQLPMQRQQQRREEEELRLRQQEAQMRQKEAVRRALMDEAEMKFRGEQLALEKGQAERGAAKEEREAVESYLSYLPLEGLEGTPPAMEERIQKQGYGGFIRPGTVGGVGPLPPRGGVEGAAPVPGVPMTGPRTMPLMPPQLKSMMASQQAQDERADLTRQGQLDRLILSLGSKEEIAEATHRARMAEVNARLQEVKNAEERVKIARDAETRQAATADLQRRMDAANAAIRALQASGNVTLPDTSQAELNKIREMLEPLMAPSAPVAPSTSRSTASPSVDPHIDAQLKAAGGDWDRVLQEAQSPEIIEDLKSYSIDPAAYVRRIRARKLGATLRGSPNATPNR